MNHTNISFGIIQNTEWNRLSSNTLRSQQTLPFQSEYVFTTIWTQVQPLVTNKSISDCLYLVPLFPPGVYKDHVFDVTSKFFRGKRFALKPWGQGVGSSRLVETVLASVSKEHFLPAFRSSTESFVAIQAI